MRIIGTAAFSRLVRDNIQMTNGSTLFKVFYGHRKTGHNQIPLYFYRSDNVSNLKPILTPMCTDIVYDQSTHSELVKSFSGDGSNSDRGCFVAVDVNNSSMSKETDKLISTDYIGALKMIEERQYGLTRYIIDENSDNYIGSTNNPSEIADIIDKGMSHNRTFIMFELNGVLNVVIVTRMVEDSLLRLVRYDRKSGCAYFAGTISGKAVYQKVLLKPSINVGDAKFIEHVNSTTRGITQKDLWWIRHNGVIAHHAGNSLLLHSPSVSPMGYNTDILTPTYDYILNRKSVI